MSELTVALDAYAARVATLPGVDVVDRLLPGATDEELAAAEEWVGTSLPAELVVEANRVADLFGTGVDRLMPSGWRAKLVGASLPAELVEWFRWHNGVRVEDGRNFWSRMLLPLGEQLASGSRGGFLATTLANTWYLAQEHLNRGGQKVMPDVPFPVLVGDVHLGWVECVPGADFGTLWMTTINGWEVVRFESLLSYVERATVFFDRGWVVPNGLGGVQVAQPSPGNQCPPAMAAWAAREGVAGVESWWPQAERFLVDPLSPGSPEPIYNTWW